ncbi:putative DNA-binding transcriptional regulator YafY [Anaerobacterium chartisolvens]|uniref:Putative DNA-binding transcriptional regulator YafY n=1 Tax=Anaerobacterium chartisolvens TaxID=1297424 RepID=A0A369ARX4_9FIRM|nr:WYL domain-containing protein [Anaerobacterium chartisolvens]RCX12099.1 putative DNA-binding transcriptional regulator YafY [Anaerobacterium chartisolvens]
MAKSSNQKLKILYLMKIFLEATDEDNTITLNEMITELERYGITAERKSIYDDIEALHQYGIDIATRKTKTTDYFVANRLFELPELKLLVDIVQSSKFITHKKSNELIKKIESLTSVHQARKLQRQVYVANRVKTMNELIYCNVDTLHIAISENRQISFKYFEYNLDKKKQFRNSGQAYVVSPYALSWVDENYYLISHYPKNSDLTHFRVDRMGEIKLLEEPRRTLAEIIGEKSLDIAEYSKKVFNMFGGEEVAVKLQFDNSLVNVVIDRFGKDVSIEKVDENSFAVRTHVAVSSTFLAWVFQFGNKVKILSPESVVKRYKENLQEIMNSY